MSIVQSNVRILCLGTLFILIGCRESGEVVRYSIPKSQSGLEQIRDVDFGSDQSADAAPAEAIESRMVVAIASREEATWFFKITGPAGRVTAAETVWSKFLEQVRFDKKNQPIWEVPDGWMVGAKKPMRFATLSFDAEKPPVEMAVSSLGPDQDVLLNVNRWRGQLGLKPTTAETLKSQLKTITTPDTELTVFDETGELATNSMRPPFAQGMAGGMGGAEKPPGMAGKKPSATIGFDMPEGWTKGKSSSFVQARLLKTDGDQSAQISVVAMSAAANEWLPNVKRWAGEVGMDSLTDGQMKERTKEVTVDGVTGQQVHLINEATEAGKGTIAVMAKRGTLAWFFKLTGDAKLVGDSEPDFDTFLETIKFP